MDAKGNNITLQVLIDIRDEIRGTNRRVDGLTQRVDGLNDRVDGLQLKVHEMREDLSQRIAHSEIRVATAITELAGSVNDMKTMLVDRLDLRDRVAQCERDIDELKRQRPATP
jgi:uncharacterized protein YoxC